jgi:fido (protein-threonine AMPylation protein)/predicted transcriptional regulator
MIDIGQPSSGEIFDYIIQDEAISLPTVKRLLSNLVDEGKVFRTGVGRNTRYSLTSSFRLLGSIDMEQYFSREIDDRTILTGYNRDVVEDAMSSIPLFSPAEISKLESLQQQYKENVKSLSPSAYKKELERLAIDLSWKSSQIEGNTYTLLETERLLTEKLTASGRTKDEAIMLLNHKEAIDFLIEADSYLKPLTLSHIEDIHSILVKELDVDRNIRTRRVGISGTNYKPLDNEFQIKESMANMCKLINNRSNTFEKALLALLLLSYIQPFMDGNKRTARIVSNAILIDDGYCPISFRTIDSIVYKKAMLLFYEQNNVSNMKKIFIDQFEFAVSTYF